MRRLAVPLVALSALLSLSGCVGVVTTSLSDTSSGGDGPYTVTIDGRSDGAGMATVTSNQDGATEQYGNQALPYSFEVKPGTSSISVAAQESTGYAEADLSCTITDAKGDVLKKARSKGEYTTVGCATALG